MAAILVAILSRLRHPLAEEPIGERAENCDMEFAESVFWGIMPVMSVSARECGEFCAKAGTASIAWRGWAGHPLQGVMRLWKGVLDAA